MQTVDLSLAKPGDECLLRCKAWKVFEGRDGSALYPFKVGGNSYFRDGSYISGQFTGFDLLAVRRDGQVIMGSDPTPAVPSPAESPASGGGEAFHLQGKHVGWEGVTRDGRKVTVVEFVEWPKANGTTEEACRVRDHQTQWAVRLNGRLLTCKEDADDVVGPWVEPPEPVLTITEVKSTDGYVFGLVQKDPSLKHVSLKLHVYNGIPCSYIQGGALGLANSEQSPFVCRYDEWDAVQTLVAEINQLAAE